MKVSGRWCYLYRAIDRDGNLLDSISYVSIVVTGGIAFVIRHTLLARRAAGQS